MKARCPVCGAELEVPETVKRVECPYCGTVFNTDTGSKSTEHFYFPPTVANPYDYLMRFIERQYGVPKDIRENSSYKKRVLHMIPVYFFHVHGVVEVKARSRKYRFFTTTVEEVREIGIPAVDNEVAFLLEDYPFPLRGKKFLDEKTMKSGIFYKPALSLEYAQSLAEGKLNEKLSYEIENTAEDILSADYKVFKVEFKGLVHYPVWEIEYTYRGENYRAYVDGVTGTVILAEHPLAAKSRALQLTLGGVFLTTGFGLAAVIITALKASGDALLAALFAIASGIAGAVPLLTRSVQLKVKASEIREHKA